MNNKKISVILKPLQMILNEGDVTIECTHEGQILSFHDSRVNNNILRTMFRLFEGQVLETLLTEVREDGYFGVEGFMIYPEWVAEFIVVEPTASKRVPTHYTGRYEGEALQVYRSCCGVPLLDLGAINMHIANREDAESICSALMRTYERGGSVDYKGKYPTESLRVSKSCCGCPLLSIDSDGDSDTFHVDSKEDAVNICAKIMQVFS